METLVELERAWELILAHAEPLGVETVPLAEAYRRVLAEDVAARQPLPPFARSPLDGYAYSAASGDKAPLQLRVIAEIPAGTWWPGEVKAGEAVRIFTGAPLPNGVNAVVRQEDTEAEGDLVTVKVPVAPGANHVAAGDEVAAGDSLLAAGARLTPTMIGLLAASGVDHVKVYRRPVVACFSTGSELAEVGSPLAPGKIYNSNSYTLRGLLQELGCAVQAAPVVPDDLGTTVEFLRAYADADVIISTGGASVGEYDLVRQALVMAGYELIFWRVDIKPGTPVAVARKGKQLAFSLSGNPAAAMVSFELLVRPALRKYAGRTVCLDEEFSVRIAGEFPKPGRQRRFLRAKAIWRDGEIWADLESAQGSGILRSMVGSNILVDVPAGHGPVRPGELLKARWIGDWEA